MDDTIITTYYLCEEFLKAIGYRDDPQVRLSTAEVMTIALAAAAFFGGNLEASRSFLDEYGYIPKAISKGRFNRRLHAIDPCLWRTLFDLLAEVFKHNNATQSYVVDSLPVAVCDNIRIRRCKLYPPEEHGEAFRGYITSKRRYFYGLRVHLVVSGRGEPVEFSLAAASEADISLLKQLSLDLPEGSIWDLCRQGLHRLPLRGLAKRGRLAPQSSAQEEFQAANASVGRVFEQAYSPVHRDGFQ